MRFVNCDAAGNVNSDPSTATNHSYKWVVKRFASSLHDGDDSPRRDAEGRFASVDSGSRYSIVYNALGNRAAFVYPSATYEQLFDLAGNLIGTPNSYSMVFLGSRDLVTYYGGGSGNSVTEFTHLNALASTTMQTNYSGGVMGDLSFYPWGKMFTEPQAGYGFDFAGMVNVDTGLGIRFTPNRIYSLNLNRWLTPDPAGTKAVTLTDPQTWNMYAYVRNNPTTLTDPSGKCPWCIVAGAAVVAGAATYELYSFYKEHQAAQQKANKTSNDAIENGTGTEADLLAGTNAEKKLYADAGVEAIKSMNPSSGSETVLGAVVDFLGGVIQGAVVDKVVNTQTTPAGQQSDQSQQPAGQQQTPDQPQPAQQNPQVQPVPAHDPTTIIQPVTGHKPQS